MFSARERVVCLPVNSAEDRIVSEPLTRRGFIRHSMQGAAGTAALMGALGSARLAAGAVSGPGEAHGLLAGAAAVDITPRVLPVITSGGFLKAGPTR